MSVDQKNMLALEQAIKDLIEKSLAQQIRIDGLVATLSGLFERVGALETSLALLRTAAAGRGPTA